jgi:hypothetical protein
MIFAVKKLRILIAMALGCGLALACAALAAHGEGQNQQPAGLQPGPRATPLNITWLYVQPDTNSQKISQIQIGREMVVNQESGSWLDVEANTDAEELQNQSDQPMVGGQAAAPPLSGWMQAKGIVEETTPDGDQILMGAAANEEALASNPQGPANAAQAAMLLYTRLYQMFPHSPLAPEARWRAGDIQWQIEKADNAPPPGSASQNTFFRQLMDESALKKVIKLYPRTRWAALAAYDLIDNKLCGDWQNSANCPEKEAQIYERYAAEFPDGPRTAHALYEAVYRMAVLTDMFAANGDKKKSGLAREQAGKLDAQLKAHFAGSDYTWRAGALIYKLDQGIPVFSAGLE